MYFFYRKRYFLRNKNAKPNNLNEILIDYFKIGSCVIISYTTYQHLQLSLYSKAVHAGITFGDSTAKLVTLFHLS